MEGGIGKDAINRRGGQSEMKYKAFWKNVNDKKQVELIEWNESVQDYYAFIKKCIEQGFYQISITGEMMIGILGRIACENSVLVTSIDFMEDDCEENQQINEMITESRINRRNLARVMDMMRYLEDEDAVEIKRMSFMENDGESEFVQVNGLLSASNSESIFYKVVKDYIKEYIE